MDTTDDPLQVFSAEFCQGAQRGDIRLAHLVAIGDKDGVTLGELNRASLQRKLGEASGQMCGRGAAGLGAIEGDEMISDSLHFRHDP